MSNTVYLALGANLGDKEANLEEAVRQISLLESTEIQGVSAMYETEPVGYVEQDRFLNMAVRIKTGLEPLQLLERLQAIENLLKRKRDIRWGPRTIDIDILLYGNAEINEPRLTVPHPRMFERAFVLIPLKDVYGEAGLKGTNIEELIGRCGDKDGVRLFK